MTAVEPYHHVILEHVRQHPGLTAAELAAALGTSVHKMCARCATMLRGGNIFRCGPQTENHYFATEAEMLVAAPGVMAAVEERRRRQAKAKTERRNEARRAERRARGLKPKGRKSTAPKKSALSYELVRPRVNTSAQLARKEPKLVATPVVIPPHVHVQHIPTRLLPHETADPGDRVITADYMRRRQA